MDNETKYELRLDAKDFIDQLNQIQNLLRRVDGIITQQSGKKFAIDVQIKNTKITDFFDRLNKSMDRAEKSGKDFSNAIENEVSKAFNDTLKKSTSALGNMEKATRTASKRIADAARKTSDEVASTYKKQDAQLVSFINRSEAKAKESAQAVAAAYSAAFRRTKKDLNDIGVDTSNMSVKDIIKFRQDLDKMYSKRKTSQDLTSSFREGWEKTLNTVGEKMLASEERLTDVRKRNIEAETEKYKAEKLKAEKWVQNQIDAQAAKEEQRRVRMALYGRNVARASQLLQSQIAENSTPEEQKLLSKYNRAVQRIRGIYQSAIVHGRVESPETILAGLTELQQRSLALNNFRLSEQMGINELNQQLKTTVKHMEDIGTTWNKVSSVVQNTVQAFSAIQSFATRITSTLTNLARNVLTRISSRVTTLVGEATEAFKSLEVSMIGFRNFFGEEQSNRLYQRIKSIAAEAPGLGTTDLAEYVRQIAPVAEHDANLALNASLGMLKTIQYGGASGSTEMEYVIKNIRDVISKGQATAIDIRQFNRAMPIFEEVLESVGQSQLLKDGVLTIDKDNVDTILTAFAELNTSNQSVVKDIFSQMNKTLSGQWEQFREQFTTNLMEMLRGSGVYGGIQNALMQINSGAYVEDTLARIGNAISDFINNINWFKVQRVANEVWESLKIIWEGVQDALNSIKTAIGGRPESIVTSFSKWIADIIRGMGDGVAQVIKFIQYLERSGIMSGLSRVLGWFGSAGAMLTKVLGTLFSHLTNISGNVIQLAARFRKFNITNQLTQLNAQLDAVPLRARSQLATGSDLLNGTNAASSEVGAINKLTNIVNTHLAKIEANQTSGKSTLGRVETALNNGKRFMWTDDFDGAGHGAIGTWDNSTKSWNWRGYNNRAAGYAEYQRLTTQNRLQASDSAFLQRIGDNKVVNATLKWIKTAGNKVLNTVQKLMGNLVQGGIALSLTTAVTGIIESLDMFGDATTAIAGVVKSAGYALTGALVGRTFGGITGGVVGALIGLGVGIADLVNTIKKKNEELYNTEVLESLDDAEQAMYDQAVALLKEYGFPVDKESKVGAGALQQLAYYIKSTPVNNRSAEEAVRYYNEAYKMLSVGYALDNFAKDQSYGAIGGNALDLSNTSEELAIALAEMVRKYGLAERNGYYYGEGTGGRSYYRDEALTEEIPAEELLENAFPDGVTDKQARALLEKANELDKTYSESTISKLDALVTDNTEFKSALTSIDNNVRGILSAVLLRSNTALSPESIERIYGAEAGAAAEQYSSRYQNFNGWFGSFMKSGGIFSPIGATINDAPNVMDAGAYEFGIVYPKIMEEKVLATAERDTSRADFLNNWAEELINIVKNPDYDAYDYMQWVYYKLREYNNAFGRNMKFASGGVVPAFAASGIDTIPAMLAPGEFVMKPSVVKKAGLGVMHALNRGDMGAAARSLAQHISNRTWNRNETSTVTNKVTKYNTNNFHIVNKNASARMNSYFSLANRLRF